jgi:hypothetical protein
MQNKNIPGQLFSYSSQGQDTCDGGNSLTELLSKRSCESQEFDYQK